MTEPVLETSDFWVIDLSGLLEYFVDCKLITSTCVISSALNLVWLASETVLTPMIDEETKAPTLRNTKMVGGRAITETDSDT